MCKPKMASVFIVTAFKKPLDHKIKAFIYLVILQTR